MWCTYTWKNEQKIVNYLLHYIFVKLRKKIVNSIYEGVAISQKKWMQFTQKEKTTFTESLLIYKGLQVLITKTSFVK